MPKLLWAGLPNEGISASLDGNDVFLTIVERPIPDENARGIGETTDDRSQLVVLEIETNGARAEYLFVLMPSPVPLNGFIHP